MAALSDAKRREVLLSLADAVEEQTTALLAANAIDLSSMEPSNPLYDRPLLTSERIALIASGIRSVASLPSPLDRVLADRTMPNGLRLRKVTFPFGVIGIIYEARPNVTFDVFSLCFKAGSACVLKGGKDADASNRAALEIIRAVLASADVTTEAVQLLPPTHEAVSELLNAVGYVDLVIPRGGRRLIDFVRDNAKVPCIETGAGVVDAYFDLEGDLSMGKAIVLNAKTRRVSVCNALDCLIVHSERLRDLPALVAPLAAHGVILYADALSYEALSASYPLLEHSGPDTFGTEYMDYKMSVKAVSSLEEALGHIARYGSGHSECIITGNPATGREFQARVDAACVYVNAPTSFTDGGEFGLGAEIGISTQKLGARGPMGLEEITTYKWLIDGTGQVR